MSVAFSCSNGRRYCTTTVAPTAIRHCTQSPSNFFSYACKHLICLTLEAEVLCWTSTMPRAIRAPWRTKSVLSESAIGRSRSTASCIPLESVNLEINGICRKEENWKQRKKNALSVVEGIRRRNKSEKRNFNAKEIEWIRKYQKGLTEVKSKTDYKEALPSSTGDTNSHSGPITNVWVVTFSKERNLRCAKG